MALPSRVDENPHPSMMINASGPRLFINESLPADQLQIVYSLRCHSWISVMLLGLLTVGLRAPSSCCQSGLYARSGERPAWRDSARLRPNPLLSGGAGYIL